MRKQLDSLLSGSLHRFPRVEQRHVLSRAPSRRQIAVVRTVRVTRLTRIIHGTGIVPVPEIYNDTKRWTMGITKIGDMIMSHIRCIGAATPFEGADVQF